jgi:serine/threonine protein kinase
VNPDRRTLRTGIPTTLGTELEGLLSSFLPRDDGKARYRLERLLGRGTLFVTFAATRIGEEGAVPFVVKVLRPSLALAWPEGVRVLSRDQAKVMAILNDRVPPSPHVVRLLEAGELARDLSRGVDVNVPWLALELVDGGANGTSLFDRVRHAVTSSGASLAPSTVLATLRGVARGLDWVHTHGLLHRGLSPNNVLLSGHGAETIAKVTDVAIARPLGLPTDFGFAPGRDERLPIVSSEPYRAPEQYGHDALGPSVDVFAFAAVARFVLIGHGPSPVDPPMIDEPALHPAFRTEADSLAQIERTLSAACAYDPAERPPTVDSLWSELEPILVRVSEARLDPGSLRNIGREAARNQPGVWFWSERHRPHQERQEVHLHALSPDPEGNALGLGRLTRAGAAESTRRPPHGAGDRLIYFDGMSWRALGSAPLLRTPRAVASVGTAQWLVIGDGAQCELLDANGWHEIVRGGTTTTALHFDLAYGAGNVIAVVGSAPGEPPALLVSVGGVWRAPIVLEGAATVSALARLDAAGHVLVGRSSQGGPYVAAYDQATHHLRSQRPVGDAALFGLASDGFGTAFAVGAHGTVVRIQRFPETVGRLACVLEQVATVDDLTSIALAEGVTWCASAHAIFRREVVDRTTQSWTQVWSDDDPSAPIAALVARPSGLLAFTSRGVVIEGRPLG